MYLHLEKGEIFKEKYVQLESKTLEQKLMSTEAAFSFSSQIVVWVKQCATKTRFPYREPKPRSNFGIGIGAKTFIQKAKLFFSNFSKGEMH